MADKIPDDSGALRARRASRTPASPGVHAMSSLGRGLQHLPDPKPAGFRILPRRAESAEQPRRWSTRRTLIFVLVSNALAWTIIIWTVIALFG